MPNLAMTLPEVSQSVMRPIVIDIVSQLQEITKITKNAKIFFPGETEKMQQSGTSIDDDGLASSRDPLTNNDRYVFIEVEEDYDKEALSTTAVTYREQNSIFIDSALMVAIAPVYVTSNVTINFKYRTESKTEALRWRDDIRFRVSQMRDINLHDLTYHYMLPEPFVALLKVIHEQREATAGYGESFEDYIRMQSTSRLGYVSNLTNSTRRLAVSETQARVVGMYGFDGVPDKPERDTATGTWTVTLPYHFTYERPLACAMRYPIIVHNELLPDEYIVFTEGGEDITKKNLSFNQSLGALNYFEQQTRHKAVSTPRLAIYIPDIDEFTPQQVMPKTGTVLYVLCTFANDDLKTLINLNELGDITLDAEILKFLRESEYPYICRPYKSIFQLSYYRGHYLGSDRSITCDSNLDIKLVKDGDLRKEHRLRLSLVTDLSMLDQDALKRLSRYPNVLKNVSRAIDTQISTWIGLDPNRTTRWESLEAAKRSRIKFNTVQTSYIVAYKKH